MAASEARLEVANLVERLRDASGVDLETLTDIEPVEPNQHGVLKAEARELRDRLDKMGQVNLLALDEYKDQKDRLDFLDAQLADMEAAKRTLLETIDKINSAARTLFETTFNQVQENFSGLFTQLFEGGEARVALDVPDDPLESAISISARPRGKRPVSILQLSGGERALTAIALLFSLYMVKPSPFCILDEIDAPLDDANIGRFLSIIQRFSAQTQFIIITHNKMTMQATDALYGVTMESPGISKVVSVRLSEAVEVANA
jgi:chromosome segregation protein